MEILRTVPIAERLSTEAHYIRTLNTTVEGLNKQIPGRTRAEYRLVKRIVAPPPLVAPPQAQEEAQ